MPREYVTSRKDTLKSIALRYYGDASQYPRILQANPSLKGVITSGAATSILNSNTQLITGQKISLPDIAEIANLYRNDIAESVGYVLSDDITVVINGEAFRYWNGLNIKFSFDTIGDEFAFKCPFEPDLPEHRRAFKPFYQPTLIYVGGQLVIDGQSYAVPELSDSGTMVNVRGYTKTGALDKSCINDPFEFIGGSTFKQIATDIARRFGIKVKITSRAASLANKAYEDPITFSNTEFAGGKLNQLARELGVILSSDCDGSLIIDKALLTGDIVRSFSPDNPILLDVTPGYNANQLHTDYKGYSPVSASEIFGDQSATLKAFDMPGIIRTLKAITPPESSNTDILPALKAERGRAYGEFFSLSIRVLGWRDDNDDLYKKNTLISLVYPRAMIYKETKFLIRDVSMQRDDSNQVCELSLVLPESFAGEEIKFNFDV